MDEKIKADNINYKCGPTNHKRETYVVMKLGQDEAELQVTYNLDSNRNKISSISQINSTIVSLIATQS